MTPTELRVLDAAKSCLEKWGVDKVTIDDIAASAGVSRATLYRMFPGGKDVLFDALRVRELEDFFGLGDLLVREAHRAGHARPNAPPPDERRRA